MESNGAVSGEIEKRRARVTARWSLRICDVFSGGTVGHACTRSVIRTRFGRARVVKRFPTRAIERDESQVHRMRPSGDPRIRGFRCSAPQVGRVRRACLPSLIVKKGEPGGPFWGLSVRPIDWNRCQVQRMAHGGDLG